MGMKSLENLLEQFPVDPDLKPRIVQFKTHANIVARLAYVTFLGNAIRLVPFFKVGALPSSCSFIQAAASRLIARKPMKNCDASYSLDCAGR